MWGYVDPHGSERKTRERETSYYSTAGQVVYSCAQGFRHATRKPHLQGSLGRMRKEGDVLIQSKSSERGELDLQAPWLPGSRSPGVLCETRLHDRDSRVTLNTKA